MLLFSKILEIGVTENSGFLAAGNPAILQKSHQQLAKTRKCSANDVMARFKYVLHTNGVLSKGFFRGVYDRPGKISDKKNPRVQPLQV